MSFLYTNRKMLVTCHFCLYLTHSCLLAAHILSSSVCVCVCVCGIYEKLKSRQTHYTIKGDLLFCYIVLMLFLCSTRTCFAAFYLDFFSGNLTIFFFLKPTFYLHFFSRNVTIFFSKQKYFILEI